MEANLTRGQHYRELAAQMRKTAEDETDEKRHIDLTELANQYDGLAANLAKRHANLHPT